MVHASHSGQEVWGLIPRPVKSGTASPTARHRCDIPSELCFPGAKPRRWTPPLVTSYSVYRKYDDDLIYFYWLLKKNIKINSSSRNLQLTAFAICILLPSPPSADLYHQANLVCSLYELSVTRISPSQLPPSPHEPKSNLHYTRGITLKRVTSGGTISAT